MVYCFGEVKTGIQAASHITPIVKRRHPCLLAHLLLDFTSCLHVYFYFMCMVPFLCVGLRDMCMQCPQMPEEAVRSS